MSSAQLAAGTVLDGITLGSAVRTRVGAVTYDGVDGQGRSVGVTVYDPACFPSALVLERSLREIRQLQTIDHPRIAKVLACGKLPSGGTYEVHVPLPGASLADHLAAGPVAVGDAIALAQQIGEALVEAQKAGVIHRNLGAEVVFPSPDGVIVTGFAVGAPLGGRSFGAYDAIAPEQVEGKVVDQRTLIYNLAALIVYMLRGAPLFVGEVASVLADHLTSEVPADVPHPLPRALAKDPRMRPMMLRQFLGELPGITGAPPRPGAAQAPPSSRGWTMFTSAVDSDATQAAAAASGAPPVAAAVPSKPSTRGWTMFTHDDAPSAASPTAATTPSPASAPSSASAAPPTPAPAPVPDAGAPATPSTRGWTMFMQAADGSAPAPTPTPTPAASGGTVVKTPSPQPAAAAAAPAPPGAMPDPDAPTPTTRGWTMFMTEGGTEVAAPPAATAAPVATATVAHPQSSPAAAPPAVVPPPGAVPPPPTTGEAKPTSRGWTMFTKDDAAPAATGGPPPPPPPSTAPAITVPAASAATPVVPVPSAEPAPPTGESPPSSRGWTLFMEPSTAAQAAATAGAGPGPNASAPPSAAPPTPGAPGSTALTPVAPDSDAPVAGGSRRGWTMFMETPINEAAQKSFGPTGTPTTPVPPADEASSDNRGWTVFGTPSPMPGADPSAPIPVAPTGTVPSPAASPQHDPARTVVTAHVPARPPPQPTAPITVPSMPTGPIEDLPSPGDTPARGKTIIAPGMQAMTGAPGEVTGRAGGPPPMPDTQYFRRGDISPERPTQRTQDMDRPGARPDDGFGDSLAISHDASIAPRSSGARTTLIVLGGLVVVGGVVAAVLYLT